MKPPPSRHWRSYGTEPLPTPAEALQQPMRAFPSWFLIDGVSSRPVRRIVLMG